MQFNQPLYFKYQPVLTTKLCAWKSSAHGDAQGTKKHCTLDSTQRTCKRCNNGWKRRCWWKGGAGTPIHMCVFDRVLIHTCAAISRCFDLVSLDGLCRFDICQFLLWNILSFGVKISNVSRVIVESILILIADCDCELVPAIYLQCEKALLRCRVSRALVWVRQRAHLSWLTAALADRVKFRDKVIPCRHNLRLLCFWTVPVN